MSDSKHPDDLGKLSANDHSNLMRVANHHDQKLYGRQINVAEAVKKAAAVDVTVAKPVTVESLEFPETDPFGNNENNRRVAARIARQGSRKYLNNSEPTHIGDPAKARKDLELSLRLNPPSQLPNTDELPTAVPSGEPLVPSPGSPAASKASVFKP